MRAVDYKSRPREHLGAMGNGPSAQPPDAEEEAAVAAEVAPPPPTILSGLDALATLRHLREIQRETERAVEIVEARLSARREPRSGPAPKIAKKQRPGKKAVSKAPPPSPLSPP